MGTKASFQDPVNSVTFQAQTYKDTLLKKKNIGT